MGPTNFYFKKLVKTFDVDITAYLLDVPINDCMYERNAVFFND